VVNSLEQLGANEEDTEKEKSTEQEPTEKVEEEKSAEQETTEKEEEQPNE